MDRKLLLGLIFLFGGFLFVSLASRRITAACSQERTQAKKGSGLLAALFATKGSTSLSLPLV